MPGVECPKHGVRRALVFCDHAGAVVNERRTERVYVQCGQFSWVTVCEACVRSPDLARILVEASCLVCTDCATEWVELTGNRYSERCRAAEPEFPEDMAPIPPEDLAYYSDDELDSMDWMPAFEVKVFMALKRRATTHEVEGIVREYKDKGLMQKDAHEVLSMLVERSKPEDEAPKRIGDLTDIITRVYSSDAEPPSVPTPGDAEDRDESGGQ